ncbi:MAG: phosphoribosyl-AMP cyclohydrolase [Proteobacteria bacterium]|nr:phosphoribosyl-AMP cyclohydrolase [Pseudomonadota bacterium]
MRFAPPGSAQDVEEGRQFTPRFDAGGLIVCVVSDARSGELLMVAYMNAEALARTLASGQAWYYSRSRQRLWRKGETSGHTQRLVELRTDCDQDTLWLKVEQAQAGACHTGRRSCFYRAVALDATPPAPLMLKFDDEAQVFDPAQVYRKHDDPKA